MHMSINADYFRMKRLFSHAYHHQNPFQVGHANLYQDHQKNVGKV